MTSLLKIDNNTPALSTAGKNQSHWSFPPIPELPCAEDPIQQIQPRKITPIKPIPIRPFCSPSTVPQQAPTPMPMQNNYPAGFTEYYAVQQAALLIQQIQYNYQNPQCAIPLAQIIAKPVPLHGTLPSFSTLLSSANTTEPELFSDNSLLPTESEIPLPVEVSPTKNWDTRLNNPSLTTEQQNDLVEELELNTDAQIKDWVEKAEKLESYQHDPFFCIQKIINEARVDELLEHCGIWISDDQLQQFKHRSLTEMQAAKLIKLMTATVIGNDFVVLCRERYTALCTAWPTLEPENASNLPHHIILPIAIAIEDAANKNSQEIEPVPYYIFGRTLIYKFDTKTFTIVARESKEFGGFKVFRWGLQGFFAKDKKDTYTKVGVTKTQIKCSDDLDTITNEVEVQQELQEPNTSCIAKVDYMVKVASKTNLTRTPFNQVFIIGNLYDQNLETLVTNNKNFSETLRLQIALEMLYGLQHIHSNNYIHHDFKPGNVFMKGNHAFVADFGLIKEKKFYTHEFYGTPLYSDPSLLRQNRYSLYEGDFTKVDMYAFGLSLFQCLQNGDLPPWCSTMNKIYSLKHPEDSDDDSDTDEIADQVEEKIKKILDTTKQYRKTIALQLSIQSSKTSSQITFTATKIASGDDLLRYLTYRCLDTTPFRRPSAQAAYFWLKKQIKTIAAGHKALSIEIQPRYSI